MKIQMVGFNDEKELDVSTAHLSQFLIIIIIKKNCYHNFVL